MAEQHGVEQRDEFVYDKTNRFRRFRVPADRPIEEEEWDSGIGVWMSTETRLRGERTNQWLLTGLAAMGVFAVGFWVGRYGVLAVTVGLIEAVGWLALLFGSFTLQERGAHERRRGWAAVAVGVALIAGGVVAADMWDLW